MTTNGSDIPGISAWFAGPKAENGEWFAATIQRIVQDYHSWRRNYFPEDGVVVDSALKRRNEPFQDAFDDRLIELLARLKADFPFQSPRYAAHMLAEQTLPSIAGYFAAMLYNPNNVSVDAAPVTVRLEIEAAQLIARMLGHPKGSWAHLTGGGTVANIESLWIARTVKYLPLVLQDMRAATGLKPWPWPTDPRALLRIDPDEALSALDRTFAEAQAAPGDSSHAARLLIRAYLDSRYCVVERGVAAVCAEVGSHPVVLVPETHHYCFEKAMDALGLGRRSLVFVRVDQDFRMCVDDLDAKLDRAESDGRHVLAVVTVVGTTEEGAVDPVNQILDLRTRRRAAGKGSFWLHADAAYGGYLRTMTVPSRLGLGEPEAEVRIDGTSRRIPIHLPEAGACAALERLGECDSITIDPHKLGYIPYPAGAVCFKSSLVKPLARQEAPYIDDSPSDVRTEARSESIGLYILEGSKPGAAAAAVWLSHTLIPLDTGGHGRLIRQTVRNACELHALLQGYPSLAATRPGCSAVSLCAPGSNIVCYAFRPTAGGADLVRINDLNRRIYKRFTLTEGKPVYDQSFFVSRTTLLPSQYSQATVAGFLGRLGVTAADYQKHGVFLLRSVLMNPWYEQSKSRGRYFLSELVADLHRVGDEELADMGR